MFTMVNKISQDFSINHVSWSEIPNGELLIQIKKLDPLPQRYWNSHVRVGAGDEAVRGHTFKEHIGLFAFCMQGNRVNKP